MSRKREYLAVSAPAKGVMLYDLRKINTPVFDNFDYTYAKYGK